MSELVKKSTADFIRPSAREASSAFLAGLMKTSMGGSSAPSAASTASATSASGVIHSLWVKPFWMDSLCLLATLLKASTTSSIGALASNPVIGGNVVVVAVDVVVVVVVVEAVVVVVVAVDMAVVVEAKKLECIKGKKIIESILSMYIIREGLKTNVTCYTLGWREGGRVSCWSYFLRGFFLLLKNPL